MHHNGHARLGGGLPDHVKPCVRGRESPDRAVQLHHAQAQHDECAPNEPGQIFVVGVERGAGKKPGKDAHLPGGPFVDAFRHRGTMGVGEHPGKVEPGLANRCGDLGQQGTVFQPPIRTELIPNGKGEAVRKGVNVGVDSQHRIPPNRVRAA